MQFGFSSDNTGKPLYIGKVNSGAIVCWGFGPFWISDTINVGTLGPPIAGGFNIENRDGLYIVPDAQQPSKPTVIPWNGDAWVLNGTGTLDAPANIVIVELKQQC